LEDKNIDHVIPVDGMWISIFGTHGYIGLTLWFLIMGLPPMLFVLRFPGHLWAHPRVAAASLGAALLSLYVVDCILNGFLNMIFISLAGGLIGLSPASLGVTRTTWHQVGDTGRRSGTVRKAECARRSTLRPAAGRIRLADRYRSLGRAFKKKGQLAEAEAAWRQALDLLAATAVGGATPDVQRRWCDCANDLAWLRLHHPEPELQDVNFGVELARRVVETCPDCAVYWNTLGVAHLRAGDYPAAVAALDRAATLGNGGTAFDDVFLSIAHAHLGDWEQARHRLAQAMLGMERDYPGQPELAGYCDEARSILSTGPEIQHTAR
jgi:tetratricopeptide (TPR) repeat protein